MTAAGWQPARARKPSIPIVLLMGPLGAGKTTLLNRLIRDPAFADTAVILNEFGEAALDQGQSCARDTRPRHTASRSTSRHRATIMVGSRNCSTSTCARSRPVRSPRAQRVRATRAARSSVVVGSVEPTTRCHRFGRMA